MTNPISIFRTGRLFEDGAYTDERRWVSAEDYGAMESQRDHWLEIAREKDAEIERLRHGLDTVLRWSEPNSRVHEIAEETLAGRTHEPSANPVDVLCVGVVRSNPQTRQIYLAFETDEQFQAAERMLDMADSPLKSIEQPVAGDTRSGNPAPAADRLTRLSGSPEVVPSGSVNSTAIPRDDDLEDPRTVGYP